MELIQKNGWDGETIQVRVGTLTPAQAIGEPEEKDYPIIKGREHMLEAVFREARGHAFTDTAGDFEGTLREIAAMDLADNYQRAVFVAGLNAVMRRAGLAERTVHCRDASPPQCAGELARHVAEKYGKPRIAMVGLQPRMVEALSASFPIRVTDLDQDNIGRQKFGITIEGPEMTPKNLEWCDLALITGSCLANGTILDLLPDKPAIYFGVTGAGPSVLLGLERFCPYGS